MPTKKPKIEIVIPVLNSESTLPQTFKSLLSQKNKSIVDQITIVDDHSSDNSPAIINKFSKNKQFKKIKIITNNQSLGLAKNYNRIIKKSKSALILIVHSDIVIHSNNSFIKLQNIFIQQPNLFCAYPIILHPKKIWQQYNFWQKCLFSRYVGKAMPAAIQKYDCFSRDKLIKIGLFDSNKFYRAGEDIDLIIRAKKHKYLCLQSHIKVVHIHNQNPKFNLTKLIYKENQYAETKGVLLRKHGPFIIIYKSFFREVILLLIVYPPTRIWGIIALIIFSISYTPKMFTSHKLSLKLLILPFINLFRFFSNIFYTFKGFITFKQQL